MSFDICDAIEVTDECIIDGFCIELIRDDDENCYTIQHCRIGNDIYEAGLPEDVSLEQLPENFQRLI